MSATIVSRHEAVKDLAERIGKDIGSLTLLTTDDKESIVAAINEIKQVQIDLTSRIEVLEEYHDKPLDQGPTADYSGTGWYKATDTGTIYNVGVPEGETHLFEGDPKEYISVYTKEDAKLYADRAATSNITDMNSLFHGIASSFNQDISHWDTSNVTDMHRMFGNAAFFNQDLSTWNTSNVTDMSYMFSNAAAFNQDISAWDTSNNTSMSHMFYNAAAFNQYIAAWDTSSVTDMSRAFSAATSFNQDISAWDTSSVTNMNFAFYGTSSFNQNLSGWCVTNIATAPEGFAGNAAAWTQPKPVWGTCP